VRSRFRALVPDLSILRARLLEAAHVGEADSVVVLGDAPDLVAEMRESARGEVLAVGREEVEEPLPLADGGAAIVACEVLLTWIREPGRLVAEMHRVLRPGGCAIMVGEPDLQAAVEHPPQAGILGLAAGVLRRHGADPAVGRRLRDLFPLPSWMTQMHLHGMEPPAGAAGGDIDRFVLDARKVLDGEIRAAVVDRWEREARRACAEGSLVTWFPVFALLARKVVVDASATPIPPAHFPRGKGERARRAGGSVKKT